MPVMSRTGKCKTEKDRKKLQLSKQKNPDGSLALEDMSLENFHVLGINRHRMQTDGRGITTLVALAGCPLSCRYCINKELLMEEEKGEALSPRVLIERLSIDHCYFVYTNGGVTFGGGEPLLHSRQIRTFAELCPKEWNITLETSLNVPAGLLAPLLTERFSFIIDIKAMQPEIYLRYTGKENHQAVENLLTLCGHMPKENYMVKLPMIPGYSGQAEVADSRKNLQVLGIPGENIATLSYITA